MTFALHFGDCLPWLATLSDGSADTVIADPPYSEHVHSKARRGSSAPVDGGGRTPRAYFHRVTDFGFTSLTQDTMETAADHFARIAKRWVVVFCDVESSHLWAGALRSADLDYVRTMIWLKLAGTPQFTGDRPAPGYEAIALAHRPGKKRWNGGGKAGVYTHAVVQDRHGGHAGPDGFRVHTTQKPLGLMLDLVADFSDADETILDPFAGSGTTGVAALRLGRHFIGAEMDAAYHAIATERLTAEAEGTTLQAARMKQTSMFGAAK